MTRQQAFEAIYAKQHDVPAESLVQYRFESKDGYSLPGIASHYRTYCMVMDSEEIQGLRKDAERYRWLNSDAASDSGMIPEFDGDNWLVIYLDNGAGGSGGGVCEAVFCSANEAVDFAMSKGDQS